MPLFNRKPGPTGTNPSADETRERRLEEIKQLAERFTYDLGLLIAGHPVELEKYVAPEPAQRLRASLEPFLSSGDAMRPNFGEYGELRVEGNLLNLDQSIHAHVEFEDSSIRETSTGDLIPMGKRKMLLSLVIDPSCQRIADYTLAPSEDQ